MLRRTRPTPASSPLDGIYQRKSSYNQAGRLSAYSENGVVKARYTYNTFGLRTRKETDAGTKVFHYDTGITLLGESDQAGNATRDYIWLNGSPVAAVDAGGTVAFIHTDHFFTPRLATDPTGTIVWSWEGEVFGDTEPTGSLTLNLRFPGQYFDPESGRHYNVMRDYDPVLGRYVQSDPIGLVAGLNTYVYAGGRPLVLVDRDGQFGILGIGLGAVIGGVSSFAGALAQGASLGDAAISGLTGAAIGGIGGALGGITLGLGRSAAAGAGFGFGGDSASQGINIARDPCKSLSDFNLGSALGAAAGGAFAGGLNAPGRSAAKGLSGLTRFDRTALDVSQGIVGFGPSLAGSVVGGELGKPSP